MQQEYALSPTIEGNLQAFKTGMNGTMSTMNCAYEEAVQELRQNANAEVTRLKIGTDVSSGHKGEEKDITNLNGDRWVGAL